MGALCWRPGLGVKGLGFRVSPFTDRRNLTRHCLAREGL